MEKVVTVILLILLGILILLAILVAVAGKFLFHFALDPKSKYSMGDLFSTGSVMGMEFMGENAEQTPTAKAWAEEFSRCREWFWEESRSVYLTGREGIRLHGLQVSAPGHRWAVLCHGYIGKPEDLSVYARHFYDLGYSVLAPAAQGHEESEGDYYGMGWPERLHLVGWTEQITAQDPLAEIVLFGLSMGGATVMMASGEVLPEQVKGIISDCGYTSVWEEFRLQLKGLFHLPAFPILHLTDRMCRRRAGYSFREADALKQLKKANVPMLFIHGEADLFVPFFMMEEAYSACGSREKEKVSIPLAPHGSSSITDPGRYWAAAEAFLHRHIGK